MRNVIRLGDLTTHGGKVISAKATHFKVAGIAVACVGDLCVCPIQGHSNCRIVSGSERHHINGVALAFEGDETSCGAKLISSLANFKTS
ncbi:PAAR domain-containing protein [Massilia dura]|uniref:PAAR domain-containing protein n=1 Tax=Pseudoduganella dura TaxID=321982 RepID=A0A6I3X8J3_9BURK|nr:PAAR domain-containing protein [Pseudoduganella dura]MUI13124.1 PAAR domain-containing protein [Pseudoduganella dura]GGY09951.1 hypothetical protein GCM10007386_45450 [Pseudoduganella dura]